MRKKVTILIPCFNEEASLPYLYKQLSTVISDEQYSWEVLFINDGSSDHTLDIIKELAAGDSRIKFISLSRNFGKENAMMAGFDFSTGDCTVIMDADLQHPQQLIPEMLSFWEQGYEDVFARRKNRNTDEWLRKKLSFLYYKLLQTTANFDVLPNAGDFRLLDRKCIDALTRLRETERYTKGMYCWIGYKKKEIEFEMAERVAGHSSFSYRKLIRLAMQGLTSFSTVPLKISIYLGLFVSLISFILLLVYFIKALLYGDPVAGFPTIITVVLLLGGIQLLFLGILGEYIGKIFKESKGRPIYLIGETNIDQTDC